MKNQQKKPTNFYPAALSIAGSDSSGGAGIQADLRTFNAFGVFGCTAITAITAQNPKKVLDIQGVNPEIVARQIEAVVQDIGIKFAKTGMLFNAGIVRAVAEAAERYKIKLVIDPVMVATSGAVLLQESAILTIKNELLKQGYLITPNIPEAELLLNEKIKSADDMVKGALKLAETYQTNILLKGGHFTQGKNAIDIAVINGKAFKLSSPLLENCRHSHGTGCTLSAAICANLALGEDLEDSICEGKTFVFGSLAEPVRLGENTEVMYPPESDYSDYIVWTPIK